MPWCDECARLVPDRQVAPDGTCMTCGSFIAGSGESEEAAEKVPWHFWLLVAALVVYLGWRVLQLFGLVD